MCFGNTFLNYVIFILLTMICHYFLFHFKIHKTVLHIHINHDFKQFRLSVLEHINKTLSKPTNSSQSDVHHMTILRLQQVYTYCNSSLPLCPTPCSIALLLKAALIQVSDYRLLWASGLYHESWWYNGGGLSWVVRVWNRKWRVNDGRLELQYV
jgi:hypothetical protein